MAKSQTGLARPRANGAAPMPSKAIVPSRVLGQDHVPGASVNQRMNDTLVNLMTGMGTERDKLTGTVFGYSTLAKSQLDAAYAGDWISRKGVDIPAFDSFREWRSWQAEKADITLIEDLEKNLKLRRKAMQAMIKGRLYGGGALILGIDQGTSDQPLEIERVGKDQLKFVHPVSRHDLSSGNLNWDPMSEFFGQPDYYTLSGKTGGVPVKIHPSRVIRFAGAEAADPNLTSGWGDSILQICADAIITCGTVAQSTAQLVAEAKLDIIKVPDLTEMITNTEYEQALKKRFGMAATMKSVFGMLVVDKEEEWDRIDQQFAALPDILKMYLLICTGALDIPATRFLGQSPTGLNSTGDSDTRNYYDRVSSEQNVEISPNMERLDRILLRSALGDEPDGVFYEWNPLWQMTESEKADVAVKKATVMTADVNAGLITPVVLQKARENQLIEDGTYPGLELLIDEFGDTVDERAAEAAAQAAEIAAGAAGNQPQPANSNEPGATPEPAPSSSGPQPQPPKSAAASGARGRAVQTDGIADRMRKGAGKKKRADGRRKGAMADASTPRTLYIRRDVINAAEIRAWAKKQGFASALSDLHVTIIYSKTPVDWLKAGNDDFGSDADGNLMVKPGGPRVMERFGKAIVLGFANSDLSYRHRSIMYRCEEDGISWSHDDYTPHMTISYQAPLDIDLSQIEPYQGAIELGPEVFEEIKADFNNEVDAKEVEL